MKKWWHQQIEFRELIFKQLTPHKNDINALAETIEDISHTIKHLNSVAGTLDLISRLQYCYDLDS
jgi:hypothetical protein